MKHFYNKGFTLSIALMLVLSGCATILGGKKNQLLVEDGQPPSAEVWLDGQKIGETPFNAKLDKFLIQDGSLLEIKKEGFVTKPIILNREIHPWYTLADILTGGIWFGIDLGSGNLYRPSNNKLSYELESKN